MSIRLLQGFLRNGRNLLFADRRFHYQFRAVQKIAFKQSLKQESILADIHVNQYKDNYKFAKFSRRLLVDNVLSRVTSPKSSALRTEATKRFVFGDSLPFFSLVGCSLASGNGIITKEDELESICCEIRVAVEKYQSKLEDKVIENRPIKEDLSLDDLNIGPMISKGCSAAVYCASFKNNTDTENEHQRLFTSVNNENDAIDDRTDVGFINLSTQKSDAIKIAKNEYPMSYTPGSSNFNMSQRKEPQVEPNKSIQSVKFDDNNLSTVYEYEHTSDEEPRRSPVQLMNPNIYDYPLALKMMFNYDIQSNSMAILKAMHKETIPARYHAKRNNYDYWENDMIERTSNLPPHPNIVYMPAFFCDIIPDLENSRSLYPNALPPRLNPSTGYGRNMSLFLLMKRYNYSLREYLDEYSCTDIRTRIILFAQLLEAVAHINKHQIAHRDLKSDNILIDATSDSLPILVLSDFGCCLADKNGLKVPYQSIEIDKGGNVQLMAPEIVLKQPNIFAMLDYTKSDLWAAGTIAYEIFGYVNPFYDDLNSNRKALRNVHYDESMLPELDNEEIPHIVKNLIENILQCNPRKRLDCDIAANVLELYLWAPSSWIKYKRIPTNNEILEWLLSLTTKILCERGLGSINAQFMSKNRRTYTEYILISTFLARANLKNIRKALQWIHSIL